MGVRCIDTYGGYSEASTSVTVAKPTDVDVNALNDQFSTLADEQNTGQLVALASTFVSTLSDGGAQLSEAQKKLQMQMTDSVSQDNILDEKDMTENAATTPYFPKMPHASMVARISVLSLFSVK